ncbi:MAG: nucleoside monophosphate kinase [Candidatus Hadarchaeales archaeon]
MGGKALRLLIFGPPGSGKGTHAARLEPFLGTRVISTGDLFRKSVEDGSELGRRVKEYLDSGRLVPDDLVIEVVRKEMNSLGERGVILDGFPRTVQQAKALDGIMRVDGIIHMDIPKETIVQRMAARRTCEGCGRVYNLMVLKPKVDDICDECGGRLTQRKDDLPEVIERRFRVFQEQTAPLLEYYKNRVPVIRVTYTDPGIAPERVTSMILEGLKRAGLYSEKS